MLEEHEIKAMLYVLEKHFDEPILPLSVYQGSAQTWVEDMEAMYASEEDPPEWIKHAYRVIEKLNESRFETDYNELTSKLF